MILKKMLSILLLVCLVYSFIPASSLAAEYTTIDMIDLPVDVTGVVARFNGIDYPCAKTAEGWTATAAAGTMIEIDTIESVTVTWGTHEGPVTITYPATDYITIYGGTNNIGLLDWQFGSIMIDNWYHGSYPGGSVAADLFRIYDSSGRCVRSAEIESSAVTFEYLLPGSYTVEIEDRSDGFHYLEGEVQRSITVAADQDITERFDHYVGGALSVTKEVEGEGAPVNAVFTFRIINSASGSVAQTALIHAGETYHTVLPYGDYVVREVNIPNGFTPLGEVEAEISFSPQIVQGFLMFANVYDASTLAQESFTVSYHPNGGAGNAPVDNNRYYKGDKVCLKSGTGFAKAGSVFVGWSLTPDGSALSDPYTMGDGDVTLFAVWQTAGVGLPPKTGDASSVIGFAMVFIAIIAFGVAVLRKIRV